MSGNPVKIGDGCATVTGYELPKPLIASIGKAGARFKPEVRIPIGSRSSGNLVESGELIVESRKAASLNTQL